MSAFDYAGAGYYLDTSPGRIMYFYNRGNNCNDRNHININTGLNRTQYLYGEIPCHKAKCGRV